MEEMGSFASKNNKLDELLTLISIRSRAFKEKCANARTDEEVFLLV